MVRYEALISIVLSYQPQVKGPERSCEVEGSGLDWKPKSGRPVEVCAARACTDVANTRPGQARRGEARQDKAREEVTANGKTMPGKRYST